MKSMPFILFLLFLEITFPGQQTKLIKKKFDHSGQIAKQYFVLKSDGTTRVGLFVSYFRMTNREYKSFKDDSARISYYIKEKGTYKNGAKDGAWVYYSKPNTLKSKGEFNMGHKVGIWLTSREHGLVLERFDYDSNKKLRPIIQLNDVYPQSAIDAHIQGKVLVSFEKHSDCSITNIRIINPLAPDCDSLALKTARKLGELFEKYGVDCKEIKDTITVNFSLY